MRFILHAIFKGRYQRKYPSCIYARSILSRVKRNNGKGHFWTLCGVSKLLGNYSIIALLLKVREFHRGTLSAFGKIIPLSLSRSPRHITIKNPHVFHMYATYPPLLFSLWCYIGLQYPQSLLWKLEVEKNSPRFYEIYIFVEIYDKKNNNNKSLI